MKIETVLNHLERLANWSYKEDKFVTIPEELHHINMKAFYENIQEQGFNVELGPDGSFSFKVTLSEFFPEEE